MCIRDSWEGDTLVVETQNFTGKTSSFSPHITRAIGSGENMSLIERFTRTDKATLHYEYTVTDPSTFTRPFTAAIPMAATDGHIYEYACHEGNHGLENILRGAREEEAERAAQLLGLTSSEEVGYEITLVFFYWFRDGNSSCSLCSV